jgi:hypothetical protein
LADALTVQDALASGGVKDMAEGAVDVLENLAEAADEFRVALAGGVDPVGAVLAGEGTVLG